MSAQENLDVSVIIPAYNEGERIGRTLLEIRDYFEHTGQTYEIIVVIDGSPDNTANIVQNYSEQIERIRIINNDKNYGKGYVVRQGLLAATGKWHLFMDADGSTAITHLEKFMSELESGYDIVIGSRDIKGAFIQVHQPRHREISGNMGNWLIRIVLGLWKYPDTQCGFKVLSLEASHDIASRMVVDRFGFDFELIALSERLNYRVKQLPVRWLNEEGSSVTLFGPNGFIQVIIDLFKTRSRFLFGRYHLNKE